MADLTTVAAILGVVSGSVLATHLVDRWYFARKIEQVETAAEKRVLEWNKWNS